MPDSGAAAARTVLAWRRTGLSLFALAALSVRTVGSSRTTLLVAPALMLVGVVLVAVHGRRLQRRSDRVLAAEPPLAISVVALTAGCVAVAGLAVVGVLSG